MEWIKKLKVDDRVFLCAKFKDAFRPRSKFYIHKGIIKEIDDGKIVVHVPLLKTDFLRKVELPRNGIYKNESSKCEIWVENINNEEYINKYEESIRMMRKSHIISVLEEVTDFTDLNLSQLEELVGIDTSIWDEYYK